MHPFVKSICQGTSSATPLGTEVLSKITIKTTDEEWCNILSLHSSLNYTDSDGKHHALSKAACCGNLELIDSIYRWAGPEIINFGNPKGETALFCIMKYPTRNLFSVAKKLIELGANVNVQNYEGYSTPLDLATSKADPVKRAIVIRLLILNGAVSHSEISSGQTDIIPEQLLRRIAKISNAKKDWEKLCQVHIILEIAKKKSDKGLSGHSICILPTDIINLISHIYICLIKNSL